MTDFGESQIRRTTRDIHFSNTNGLSGRVRTQLDIAVRSNYKFPSSSTWDVASSDPLFDFGMMALGVLTPRKLSPGPRSAALFWASGIWGARFFFFFSEGSPFWGLGERETNRKPPGSPVALFFFALPHALCP